MITIVKDTPNLFKGQPYIISDDQKKALDIIASAVVNKKGQVIKFLKKYNYQVNETGIKEKDLIEGLTIVFNSNDAAKTDFLKLSNSNSFSNVNASDTTVIGGILSSLSGIFGALKKTDTTAQSAAIQAQLAQVIIDKQAQQARNQKIAVGVVIILVLGAITAIVLYYHKQNK
jgi:hypothetical protein